MIYRHTPTARGEACPWTYTLPAEQQHDDARWRACYSWDGCEKQCSRHHSAALDRQRAARRDPAHPRKFPFPKVEGQDLKAHCNWCGRAIATSRANSRGWHDGREGEPDCRYAYDLHTDPRVQKAFLLDRDGLGCCDCGEVRGRWFVWWTMRGDWRERRLGASYERSYPSDVFVGDADMIGWSTELQLEHQVPLWRVAHLPDDERAIYFGPENLRLRCGRCHAEKTRAEAAERAAARRSVSAP